MALLVTKYSILSLGHLTCLCMLPRWPCCWSSRSQPTTLNLQKERAVWIPPFRQHFDAPFSQPLELLRLTQWDVADIQWAATLLTVRKAQIEDLWMRGFLCPAVTGLDGQTFFIVNSGFLVREGIVFFFLPWDQMGSRSIYRCMVTIIVWCKILPITLLIITNPFW